MRSVELRTPGGATLRCRLADGFASRFLGLMGRVGARRTGEGMLFVPGGSIHTFFMRFPLDVAFLSREGRVLRVAEGVRPWRLARAPRGTRFVLELAAGQAAADGVAEGVQLELRTGAGRRSRAADGSDLVARTLRDRGLRVGISALRCVKVAIRATRHGAAEEHIGSRWAVSSGAVLVSQDRSGQQRRHSPVRLCQKPTDTFV